MVMVTVVEQLPPKTEIQGKSPSSWTVSTIWQTVSTPNLCIHQCCTL